MHPEHRTAVEASCHETALCQEEAGEVGQVGVADSHHSVRRQSKRILDTTRGERMETPFYGQGVVRDEAQQK